MGPYWSCLAFLIPTDFNETLLQIYYEHPFS